MAGVYSLQNGPQPPLPLCITTRKINCQLTHEHNRSPPVLGGPLTPQKGPRARQPNTDPITPTTPTTLSLTATLPVAPLQPSSHAVLTPPGLQRLLSSLLYLYINLSGTSRHLSRLLGHEQVQARIDTTQLGAWHYSNQGPCRLLRQRALDNALTQSPVAPQTTVSESMTAPPPRVPE